MSALIMVSWSRRQSCGHGPVARGAPSANLWRVEPRGKGGAKMSQLDAVTGAFSYTGAAIARELLKRGHQVRTLTGHPDRAPAGTPIDCRPLDFRDPKGLGASLTGVHTLYNTYWVRFAHG